MMTMDRVMFRLDPELVSRVDAHIQRVRADTGMRVSRTRVINLMVAEALGKDERPGLSDEELESEDGHVFIGLSDCEWCRRCGTVRRGVDYHPPDCRRTSLGVPRCV